jgi:2-polyprenyl-3-methyl-5-hydroxy-6-metoxy-1,4-benzoquinol methylase
MSQDSRWNHNIHYHPMILSQVPAGARTALDVGCGEGMLTRALRSRVPSVVGVDLDSPSLELARAAGENITYVCGDVLTHPFALESFDFVASVATLHHMDASHALARFSSLLRPGGRLVVLGLARSSLLDLPAAVAGVVAHQVHRRSRGFWEHPSPQVWPPPLTYSQVRRLAARSLPGVTYRRHLLFRYSLTWEKPKN